MFKRKLPELRKSKEFANIQMDPMIPPCLMDDFNLAKDVGYHCRKNNNLSARVDIVKNEIVLLTKKKDDPKAKYTKTPYKNLKKRKNSIT